jgi:2-iminobutanoate/2-iminopropanoate deaminase
MFEDIDKINWENLSGAYDSSAGVGQAIKHLLAPETDVRQNARELLWAELAHQGNVYEVTGYAVPFLVEFLAFSGGKEKGEIVGLLFSIANGHQAVEDDNPKMREVYIKNGTIDEFDLEVKKAADGWSRSTESLRAATSIFLKLLSDPDQNVRREIVPLLCSFSDEAQAKLKQILAQIQAESVAHVRAEMIEQVHAYLLTHKYLDTSLEAEFICLYKIFTESKEQPLMVRFQAAVSRFCLLQDAIAENDTKALIEAFSNSLEAHYKSVCPNEMQWFSSYKRLVIEKAIHAIGNCKKHYAVALLEAGFSCVSESQHAHAIAIALLSLTMLGKLKTVAVGIGNIPSFDDAFIRYKLTKSNLNSNQDSWKREYPIIIEKTEINLLTQDQKNSIRAILNNSLIWETETNILEMIGLPPSPAITRALLAQTSNFFQTIQPPNIYQPATYNHGMLAGNTLYVAGEVARDANGVLVAPFDASAQAKQVYYNLGAVLEAAGARPENVVKITTYLVSAEDSKAVSEARLEFFGQHRPPHTGLIVASLGSPEIRLEVEVIAVLEP